MRKALSPDSEKNFPTGLRLLRTPRSSAVIVRLAGAFAQIKMRERTEVFIFIWLVSLTG